MKKTTARPRGRKPAPAAEEETAAAAAACFCYIVECADGTYYTGWAVDAEQRLKVHNAGRGARYTSMRRPVRLVYVEPQPDRTAAMKRERAIKRLKRKAKLALIQAGHVPAEARKRDATRAG